jgi:hypothetical protein
MNWKTFAPAFFWRSLLRWTWKPLSGPLRRFLLTLRTPRRQNMSHFFVGLAESAEMAMAPGIFDELAVYATVH